MINKLVCLMGWHTSNNGYINNPYENGLEMTNSLCKYCGKHIPILGIRKFKIILGEKRQKTFIRSGKGKFIRYN